MTRINTNVSSLVAQKTLARSNAQLQTALARLSTGLRINVGKDDPAGLIASEVLRSDIVSVNRAITNSERANQLIATADSALGQVSALLNDIRGLVSEAANTGALSDEQIEANQLQVDSSLEAIDRIAQTTSFQGRRLLDGGLDFLTTSVGTADLRAAGTFGSADDAVASGTFGNQSTDAFAALTLAGTSATGSVTITAKSAGTAYNSYKLEYKASSTASGSISVSVSGTTIRVEGSAGITAGSAVTALNANASFNAIFSASVAVAGAIISAATTTDASGTTSGGAFQNLVILSARTGGAAYNNTKVELTTGAALGSETSTYDTGTNVLTVTRNASSTTAHILAAINGGTAFSAGTSGSGQGVYAANFSAANVTSAGANGNKIVLSARTGGPAYNNLVVTLVDDAGATGAETASYNTAANTLTVHKHANSTTNQLVTAINAGSAFSASTATLGLGTYAAGTTNSVTTGGATGTSTLSDLKIDQANFGTQSSIAVGVSIDTQATQGELTYSGGTLASALVLEVGGQRGFEVFNFGTGTTVNQIASALNLVSDATGVTATVSGAGLRLQSNEYGSDAFVSARALSGTFSTKSTTGAAATRDTGSNVQLRINGVEATGKGLQASLNTSTLDLSFTVNSALQSGDSFNFSITGGGANFQLGPDVVSNQQARLGIQGVSTATLGGVSGALYQLRSGGEKELATDVKGAARVVDEVISSVTSLRGRLGAFQKTTLETNIFTLNDTLEALTDAESSIRDADFAAESARLTRAQILVQSGTAVLQIANQNPQNVLALLRG
jgi:flagellin